jgi:fido (protein-threonine AMPylation protein)
MSTENRATTASSMEGRLLRSLAKAPSGLTLAQLLTLHKKVTRRTTQRMLSHLLDAGRIRAQGEARARRYFALQVSGASASDDTRDGSTASPDAFPSAIKISTDSQDILSYVDQPMPSRKPVGYQADFLESYIPNKTAYLPPALRRQLLKMGTTAQADAPAGTYSREILGRLLIDLSWASSHLEGNTYSRLDTRALIEQGQVAQGKAAIETQMILNHKSAIELLVSNLDQAQFNRFTLLNLHSALAENLLPNPADEGRIRQHAVDIGRSVYRPMAGEQAINTAFDLLLAKLQKIKDPFEQSFFVMVHLPYLQPFADINKRTSRLAANLPLFRANLCPLTFLDVPEQAYSRAMLGVYEMTRVELLRDVYVWAYERSTQEYLAVRQELVQPDPLRLAWRDLLKATVNAVVMQPSKDDLAKIRFAVKKAVPAAEREAVQALIIDELRRLHEGVLARYGLRPSDFEKWKAAR